MTRTRNRLAARAVAAAMALGGAVATTPAFAETPIGSIVDTMQTVCSSPGFTLEQRLTVLRGWEPADDSATRELLKAISESMSAEQQLREDFDSERDKDLAERYRERLVKRLAEPVDADRGAMRLLVNADDNHLALVIDALPGRFDLLVCKAMILNPTDDQLRDLALRFSLVPSQQTADIQNWQLSTVSRSELSSVQHGRSLLLLKKGDGIRLAVLNFNMTVRTR